ncbi:box C/D snoRNA protein 1 isoform X3 [Callorhinus ursinus]|uniref:box C/D snoRNA protein 1 isoform X3 n=1 Tax=Callorhinus ursinus TaxID=34884 RepID=UPI003CD03B50
MDTAVENEGTLGGGLQSGAEGARLKLESGRERVRGTAGTDAGSVEAGDGQAGMEKTEDREGSGQTAEEMRVDLTVVKQEVMDWSEMEDGMLDGRWVKQEVKDGPEVKEEKPGTLEVKQEMDSSFVVKEEKVKVKEEVMDWLDVKEEKKDNLEIKEEVFVAQNIKKEEMMDDVCVKEEKYFPKEEVMDDPKVKEEPQINPPVGFKRKLAMSSRKRSQKCETCGTEEAKYKCPRCMRYSCSLPCVKKHKAELTCNGVRDKTAYVSIQQFTEMNLLSDYRFLEDVARTADHISRDAFLKRPISNKHMYFMKNRARRQGINLKLLPNGFTKRKENSTFFDKKYYELDPYKSLRDNLRNKVIIEYPTLHVVLKESSHDMEVLHQVKSESPKNIGNEN